MRTYLPLFLFLLSFYVSEAQNIRFITPTGAGNQDGSSWGHAYPGDSIQSAINFLSLTGGGQVWIATGLYFPTIPYDGDFSNPRKKSFKMKTDVEVYGGFNGNESHIYERFDYGENGINETIFSGDIGVLGINTDNCYHVVYDTIGLSNAVLDGFSIQNGYADGSSPDNNGGGIWTRGALTIRNCVIKNNYAIRHGGGVFLGENNSMFNCIIRNNVAEEKGGGAYLLYFSTSTDPEPLIENSLIYDNTTIVTNGNGGGIFLYAGGKIVNTKVIANISRRGGGIYHWYGGESVNCIVSNNFANFGGGGIYIERGGIAVGNTVVSNRSNASATGWGVYRNYENTGYASVLRNSLLWNNGNNTKQFYAVGTGTSIEYCAVQGGYSDTGFGNGIISIESLNSGTAGLNYPCFVNPVLFQGYDAAQIQNFLNANWRLTCLSACIDSAAAALVPSWNTVDFEGNNRIIDGNGDGNALPDMGAYEFFYITHITDSICDGDSLLFAGNYLSASGIYYDTLTSVHNCDSIISLDLTVFPVVSMLMEIYLCDGSEFVFQGVTYNTEGTFYQFAPGTAFCDSLFQITIHLVYPDTLVLPDTSIYQGQILDFFGLDISTQGTYSHTLLNSVNCDSVIQQTVHIIPVDSVIYDIICEGSSYIFQNDTLFSEGMYFSVLQSQHSGDSVVCLLLTEIPADTTYLDVVYLHHGSSFDFYGTLITSPGTYYHTLTSSLGCDSVLQQLVLTRRYVTVNGAGSKNGSSWNNAYEGKDLQLAIFTVAAAGGGQVWVAKGTYYPTTGTDRTISFILYNNVELYGGFNGSETSVNQRISYALNQTNQTRLSGDINTPMDSTDNSYNVIKQQMPGYVLIDGFIIRDAFNPFFSGEGGGVYLRQGGVLRNSVIIKNHTGYKGGGVYNAGGTIENCLITLNSSGSYGGGVCMHGGTIKNSIISHNITNNGGGGIQCQFTDILVENCQILNNSTYDYGWGGGLNVETSHKVTVKNCTFSGNQSIIGGAMSNTGPSGTLIVDSCLFYANSSVNYTAPATGNLYKGVGGAVNLSRGYVSNSEFINNTATIGAGARILNNVLIEHSVFNNNQATEDGGGVSFYQNGETRFCNFINNNAQRGGGAFLDNGGTVNACVFDANTISGNGGGVFADQSGVITHSQFTNNFAHYGGGAYLTGNALLGNSVIYNNEAHYNGGGIFNSANTLSVINCEVMNNYARFKGGGLYSNNENAEVVNTNIFNNEAGDKGGGAYLYFGGKFINCNLNRNKSDNDGGGIFIEYKGKIKNSVIWGNSSQIQLLSMGTFIEIDTTAIQGGYTGPGAGSTVVNLDTMNTDTSSALFPEYINPTIFIGNATNSSDSLSLFNADWGMNCGSALIDIGRNELLPDTLTFDLKGNVRFVDGNGNGFATVDLGPIEANFTYAFEISICDGDSLFLNNTYITSPGIYTDTLVSSLGCDSINTITLSFHDIYHVHDTVFSCYGSNVSFPDGHTIANLIADTVYTSVLSGIHQCDSIVYSSVFVKQPYHFIQTDTICMNVPAYFWRGTYYDLPGIYYDSLLTAYNCDSIYELQLTVHPFYSSLETADICQGDVFHWRGNDYSASGTFFDSLLTVNNCDSIYELQLTVHPFFSSIETADICQGDVFHWRGNDYSASGTFYDSLLTAYNCDSIYELQLTVHPFFSSIETADICQGDVFHWRGNDYSASGTFYDSLLTAYNCDSIYELQLTVHPFFSSIETADICQGDVFHWRGNDYSASGTFYDSLLTAYNCDSIFELQLIVHSLPVVVMSGLDSMYCDYHPPVVMTGQPAGGFFSGQGVIGNNFDPGVAGPGNWTLAYTYTDTNNCTGSDTVFVDVDVCTEIFLQQPILPAVYPNPTTSHITVLFGLTIDNADIFIKDVSGKVILTENISNNSEIEISIIHLASGLYFVEIFGDNKLYVFKIIKN
jgi:hypothetical protein